MSKVKNDSNAESFFILFENHTGIVPAKPKGIAQGCIHLPLLRFVKGKVQPRVNVRVIGEMVDGGRHCIVLHRHNASHGFDHTGSTQGVPGHGFGG